MQLERKVFAAFVAGVLAVGGPTVAWNNATAKDQTKKVVKAYIKTTDSVSQANNVYKFSHYSRVKVPVLDSNGVAIDTVRTYQPAEVRFNPLFYTTPANVFRVEVTDTLTDSTWYIAYVQSDSTGLLDVVARIQPSAKPGE